MSGTKLQKYSVERESEINSLIPEAEKEASCKVLKLKNKTEYRIGSDGKKFKWNFWSEFFHAAMNRMAIERGFRK